MYNDRFILKRINPLNLFYIYIKIKIIIFLTITTIVCDFQSFFKHLNVV